MLKNEENDEKEEIGLVHPTLTLFDFAVIVCLLRKLKVIYVNLFTHIRQCCFTGIGV